MSIKKQYRIRVQIKGRGAIWVHGTPSRGCYTEQAEAITKYTNLAEARKYGRCWRMFHTKVFIETIGIVHEEELK